MPYKRVGTKVYKILGNGKLHLIKDHKTVEKARAHLTALNINVSAKEAGHIIPPKKP